MHKVLNVTNVSVTRSYLPILAGVNFTLKSGEGLHIKGPNGSGKTSLLMTLSGLLRPPSGEISFDRKKLCSQDFYWQGSQAALKAFLSIKDNLSLWINLEGGNPLEIPQILKILDLEFLKDELVKNLSQGQRQRASLTRLFLKFKPIWLLDEPFSHLDQDGCDLLLSTFKNHLKKGGIILFSSHQDIPIDAVQELNLGAFAYQRKAA